jgi:hypothetical protein
MLQELTQSFRWSTAIVTGICASNGCMELAVFRDMWVPTFWSNPLLSSPLKRTQWTHVNARVI